nr:hypothetical protein [Tanacetum cinerariifolium]
GAAFHVHGDRARKVDQRSLLRPAQLPVAVVVGQHGAGAQALLEVVATLAGDLRGRLLQRQLHFRQRRDRDVRADTDVDQRHAMTVFGNQVVGRHLIAVPDHTRNDGLGLAVIHALVDDDVARQHHFHEARIVAQFLKPVNDELVDVAVIVGQQNPRLNMTPVTAGVM